MRGGQRGVRPPVAGGLGAAGTQLVAAASTRGTMTERKQTSQRDSRQNVRMGCKERPTRRNRGAGGSKKEFIPWCK